MTGPAPIAAVRIHEVVTPEGVPLPLEVAAAGDRVAALLVDVLLQVVAIVLVNLGLWYQGVFTIDGDTRWALSLLLIFLVWTFYFPAFELAWQGQTPGKRLVKIRAVDARGGPVSAEAVIGRNLARQFEVLLPILAALSLGGGWILLGSLGWIAVLWLLPLFHKDRMRVGDLIAGTIVVRVPAAVLLEDLTASRPAAAPAFTDAQLDVYGIYELQVLEGVLRGARHPGHAEAIRTVAERIREKIGWEGAGDDEAFLRAFYAALRGRLERRMLFGKRRRSKHDRA